MKGNSDHHEKTNVAENYVIGIVLVFTLTVIFASCVSFSAKLRTSEYAPIGRRRQSRAQAEIPPFLGRAQFKAHAVPDNLSCSVSAFRRHAVRCPLVPMRAVLVDPVARFAFVREAIDLVLKAVRPRDTDEIPRTVF